jgi:hypothetical protein
LRQASHGNPLLVERVAYLLAMESRGKTNWEWTAFDTAFERFQRDDRTGLLGFLTERIVRHLDDEEGTRGDKLFWRLAIPRRLYRGMASILFPPADGLAVVGEARLEAYQAAGLVYRTNDPDLFFLHDENRDAFETWARQRGCWLDAEAAALHRGLRQWLDNKSGWTEERSRNLRREFHGDMRKTPYIGERPPDRDIIDSAYHLIMGYEGFEAQFEGIKRPEFWTALGSLLSLVDYERRWAADQLKDFGPNQVHGLMSIGQDEYRKFSELFGSDEVAAELRRQSLEGTLPVDWPTSDAFYAELLERFPKSAQRCRSSREDSSAIHGDRNRTRGWTRVIGRIYRE